MDVLAVLMVVAAVDQGVTLDAKVETSSGVTTQLASRWGRPTVLFYEDRYSTGLNQALKDELFKRGAREGLLDRVSVVAVANLEGLNWFPARDFALAAVRDAERKAGVAVLVDWSGELSRAPWGLPAKTSSVVVLDAAGKVAFEASGALKPAEREAVFAAVRELLPPTASSSGPR